MTGADLAREAFAIGMAVRLPYLFIVAIVIAFVLWVIRDVRVSKRASARLDERRERRIDRIDQTMRDLNHRDVAERSQDRCFEALNLMGDDLAEIVPFERKTPAQVIPMKAGGGFRR